MNILPRSNLLRLFMRQGFDYAPVQFYLCPSLESMFHKRFGENEDYQEFFNFPWRSIEPPLMKTPGKQVDWKSYFSYALKDGTSFDFWGIAHEPGSKAAMHMTRMHHPMKTFSSLNQFQEYPYPEALSDRDNLMKEQVLSLQDKGLAAVGSLVCTVWETAWYMRSMEQLMMDMLTEDPIAEYHLNRVTEIACKQAAAYAHAGVDILLLGDDVGMQESIMMSREMYVDWLKPRLKKVIETAKQIKPDILISYHSCGYVLPLIPDFIEAGIDILNPFQPECMDFKELHTQFGDEISFWGGLGTQTTMPFGNPEDVRREVFRNLEIAGDKGGLLVAPTHLLEPEVPWDNILAYVGACRDFFR